MYSRNVFFETKAGVNELERHLGRDNAIMTLSGAASYWRGQEYFKLGKVSSLDFKDGSLVAWINGSSDEHYKAEMRLEGRELTYSCSCPFGKERRFCKHLVAAALAFLACAKIPERETSHSSGVKSKIEFAKAVARLPHEELAERFVRLAENQWHLRFEIALQDAKRRSSSFLMVKTLRAAFRDAVLRESFFEEEVEGESAELFLAVLKSLLDEGFYTEVVAASSFSLNQVKAIYDDYETCSFPPETFRSILHILLDAAEKAPSPDEQFTRRLVCWALADTHDIFSKILFERIPDFGLKVRHEVKRRSAQKPKNIKPGSKRVKARKRRKKPTFEGHGLI